MSDEKAALPPVGAVATGDKGLLGHPIRQRERRCLPWLVRLVRWGLFSFAAFIFFKHVVLVRIRYGAVMPVIFWHVLPEALCKTQDREFALILDAFAPKGPKVPIGRLAENFFLTIPNWFNALAASRQYASQPHLAGSDRDLQTAEDFLLLLQREFNITKPAKQPIYSAGSAASRNATLSITNLTGPAAWIDIYYPVLNTPLERSLEILGDDGKAVWTAELEEVADETDGDAWSYSKAVPAFHGLSYDGEAKGKLIYANYGLKSDYDALVEKGVNFTGTIVLTRYGGNFRGLKVKAAEELGAAGVLIYSDSRDDGTVTEANNYNAYPHGPARNPTSVQRGSVQYLSVYPGDPTTPGHPAYENATRVDGTNIPSILSLPISWANAMVLLTSISSGEDRTVRLVNHVDTKVTPIWNPMGVIPGYIQDEVIVIGNHRDAWVLGATDPSSGTAALHEVVRGLGALLREGWRPLRTIIIASWDAEEYGLVGSTEWGEDFTDFIKKHVVAYLNLDSAVSGSRFEAQASPLLSQFIRKTAQEIPHPTNANRTLWDATQDEGPLYGLQDDAESLAMDVEAAKAADALGVLPLGANSDFTVFVQRAGVTSLTSGFRNTRSDPVYHHHSVYDSQRWQELYGDPGFGRHVAVAKLLGLQMLRLSDSYVLPFNTTHYAFELESYLSKVENLANVSALSANFAPLRDSINALQRASFDLDHEKFAAETALKALLGHPRKKKDPTHSPDHDGHRGGYQTPHTPNISPEVLKEKLRYSAPMTDGQVWRPEEVCIMLRKLFGRNFSALPRSVADTRPLRALQTVEPTRVSGEAWPRLPRPRWPRWPFPEPNDPDTLVRVWRRIRKANRQLANFERGFIDEVGLKDREWYRHLGVAPGKWSGYGGTPLPGLTEAIVVEKNATLVEYEAARLRAAIDKIAASLRA